jgi:hypothetical protein
MKTYDIVYDVVYDVVYDIVYDVTQFIQPVARLLNQPTLLPSDGALKFQAYYVVNEGLQLYRINLESTLLNNVFFYVMYHLSSFQNMHEYKVTTETGIFEFVHTSRLAIPNTVGPETYRYSKQLAAYYVETLVAFSPCYVAGDPRTQGRVDNFYYLWALDHYKDFTYKEFHKYIARKMEAFYKRHGFPLTKASKVVQEPGESQEAEIGAVVPVEGKTYVMSDSEDDKEERGAGAAADAAACGAEPAAEPAAAAAVAEPAAAANAGPA